MKYTSFWYTVQKGGKNSNNSGVVSVQTIRHSLCLWGKKSYLHLDYSGEGDGKFGDSLQIHQTFIRKLLAPSE